MGEVQLREIESKVAWNKELGLPADACAPLIVWNQDASRTHKTALSRMRQGVARAGDDEDDVDIDIADTANADDAEAEADGDAEASFDGDSSTMLDKMEEEAITNMCDNQEALAAIAKASAGTSTNEKRRAAPRKMRVQFDL